MSKLAVFDEYGLFIRFLEEGETESFDGKVAEVGENPFSDPKTPIVLNENGEAEYNGSLYVIKYKEKVTNIIKQTASRLIYDTEWRIERARDRDQLGIEAETVQDVMLEREAIRRVSNELEESILGHVKYEWDINQEQSTAELCEQIETSFTFGVKNALGRLKPNRITPLAFFSRFTPEEQGAVMTAVQQNPILNALIVSLQLADGVVLTDPRIVAGIQALEQAGLLAEGRADKILKVE